MFETKNKPWTDIVVGLLLVFLVATPLEAAMTAYTASIMWEWFLSPQYGAGPTLAGWYGVSMLFALFTLMIKKESTIKDGGVIFKALGTLAIVVFLCLVFLLSAYSVRKINGW